MAHDEIAIDPVECWNCHSKIVPVKSPSTGQDYCPACLTRIPVNSREMIESMVERIYQWRCHENHHM